MDYFITDFKNCLVAIIIFLVLFVIDFVFGLCKGIFVEGVSSSKLRMSVPKFVGYFGMILMCILLDTLIVTSTDMQYAPIGLISCVCFCIIEVSSIIENARELGINIPPVITNVIDYVKGKLLGDQKKSGGEGGTMYYNQCNYSNVGYDNPNTSKYETIATSGCGVCAACMAFNTLMGRELYSVKAMADFAMKNKARDNSGTNMVTLLKALCKAQPNYSYKTTNDINAVVNHLKNGGMAILNQGDVYNVFSTAGHFVVADKMVANNINILDPYMYGGKYTNSATRRNRIVKATEYGCVVSPSQAAKACSDRNPAYFLITYTAPKKTKPNYNAGSKYILTACVNVWDRPSTTTGRIKRVGECTADGQAHCTSSDKNANATFKPGTVVTCLEVFEDKKTGYIWLRCPSDWLPVYYKEQKRANWYNK